MNSRANHSATRCVRRPGRSRAIWGIVVLYLLSQSPIPVFHFHGDPDSQALHSSTIASHLRTCHDPTCGRHDHEPLGWHCHFLLPGMTTEVPLGEDDPGQTDHATPLLIVKVSADLWQVSSLHPIYLLPSVLQASEYSPNTLTDPSLATRHFLDGFADELSLPERLSIARC